MYVRDVAMPKCRLISAETHPNKLETVVYSQMIK